MPNYIKIKSEDGRGPWITTYTGKRFYPLDPQVEDINIEDIAHSLSQICRFNGHIRKFYSVAQHCVIVSNYCSKENKLHGLLHDAAEFCYSDLCNPIKKSGLLQNYIDLEIKLQGIIFKAYGLDENEPEEVKEIDKKVTATEARDLYKTVPNWVQFRETFPDRIKSITQLKAKKLFIYTFEQLVKERETNVENINIPAGREGTEKGI